MHHDESDVVGRKVPADDSSLQSRIEDPYNLSKRYVNTQKKDFARAIAEIRRGRKSSCWMWYVIPTPPFVVDGQERGSGTNIMYALRDLPPNQLRGFDAARAYLQFPEQEGVVLRRNYLDIMTAIGDKLEEGVKCADLMGYLDDPKLRSSARLFEYVSRVEPDATAKPDETGAASGTGTEAGKEQAKEAGKELAKEAGKEQEKEDGGSGNQPGWKLWEGLQWKGDKEVNEACMRVLKLLKEEPLNDVEEVLVQKMRGMSTSVMPERCTVN